MTFDGKAFGLEIVSAVKAHITDVVGPILARIEAVERQFAALPTVRDGIDGKDANPDQVASLAAEMILPQVKELRALVEAIPPARDGKDGVNGEPGPKGDVGDRGEKGESGLNGKDGLDAVEFILDASGHLIASMSNGTTRDLGLIQGKDGAPGRDGKDASVDLDAIKAILPSPEVDGATVARMIDEAVARQASDFAPDDVAESVSFAIKTMAGYVQKTVEAPEPRQIPLTVHVLPSVSVNLPDQAIPVVNNKMDAPIVNVQPPNVNIEIPKRGKEVTRVTEWDKSGRIKSFEKTEVEQ